MDLLWMIGLVFLVYAEAQNLTEVKGELGQSVTLHCSLDPPNIYWYVEIHSPIRGLIARTFGMNHNDTKYFVYTTFKTKYVVTGNRLVITNITAEDFRLYFCARKLNNSIIFENRLRLIPDVPVTPSTNDHQQQQHISSIWQSELVYSSLALNALLLVVIGLVFTSLCLKRKNCTFQVNDHSSFTYENPETLETPQYDEIQLPTYRAPLPADPPLECIYSKAQLPQATLPGH